MTQLAQTKISLLSWVLPFPAQKDKHRDICIYIYQIYTQVINMYTSIYTHMLYCKNMVSLRTWDHRSEMKMSNDERTLYTLYTFWNHHLELEEHQQNVKQLLRAFPKKR